MTEYRRFYIPKALWFFTVNLAERKNNRLLIEKIAVLGQVLRYMKTGKPFYMNAFEFNVSSKVSDAHAYVGRILCGLKISASYLGVCFCKV